MLKKLKVTFRINYIGIYCTIVDNVQEVLHSLNRHNLFSSMSGTLDTQWVTTKLCTVRGPTLICPVSFQPNFLPCTTILIHDMKTYLVLNHILTRINLCLQNILSGNFYLHRTIITGIL